MRGKTVRVRLLHNASIPNARWCEPVGWVPKNVIAGAELVDGAWWDEYEEVAGMVLFGDHSFELYEVAEVNLGVLRVASCGNCRVLAKVKA